MTMRRESSASAAGTPPRRTRAALSRRRSAPPAFSELFENASDIVLVNDRNGRIIAANRAAREFGGYSAQDIERGATLRDVLTPTEYEAAMELTRRALDGLPIPEVYEREVVLHDGLRRVPGLPSNPFRPRRGPDAVPA